MKREAWELTILCDLFNDCDGGSTLQFWFAFTSKTPFQDHSIQNFEWTRDNRTKLFEEKRKQCKLSFCLDTRIFINKKSNKVQLLADARQKSYE